MLDLVSHDDRDYISAFTDESEIFQTTANTGIGLLLIIRYLNRRILAATVRNGNMVLLVCVCSEKYWADTEKDLKAVAASFRLA